MILKALGKETEKQINILRELLQKSDSSAQKKLIQTDLKRIENGYKSEKENAYYLDFEFENSTHSIILHDIRLEYNGRTAQIDHIFIGRTGITLLESKSFTGELTIKDDGSLLVKYGNNINTYPNPIEQNNRHRQVLKELINDNFDLQGNTKLLGGINIDSKVLINPKTTVTNKKLPDGFERADSFATQRVKEINKMGILKVLHTASKVMTMEKNIELAEFIIKNHKPIIFDYTKKYCMKTNQKDVGFVKEENIHDQKNQTIGINTETYVCLKCKSTNLEVAYGRNYYFKCLDCDNNIPIKHTCKTPECKPRTKKRKNQFFKVCEKCGIDELFYENKS
ncbi:hypothetical protein MNB_SV-3-1530 [hydrothermal vent metagenome]|uniref:NERD domain-containing protein n=1 Tax=hydrothermal vent metagenome TaxID=652676 RepID=A0A1W1CFD4_9ZZZZ